MLFSTHIFFGMEMGHSKEFVVPHIIKEHSGLLSMLEQQGQSDWLKNPLKFADGSLVAQEDVDGFARAYQHDFDCSQLSKDELISLAQYHSFFQMNVPISNLKNALYQQFAQQKLQWVDWKLLSTDWQCSLASLLMKNKRLDIQLLKSHSDKLIDNKQKIDNNRKQHSVEKLLFFNDQLQVYGGYSLPFGMIVKGVPRFTQLLVKKDGNLKNKADVRRSRNGYWLQDTIIHPDGLWALTYYSVYKEHGKWEHIYDLVDLRAQQENVSPDVTHVADSQSSSSVCCFGKNCFYSAACYGDVNIVVRSTDLVTKKEINIVTLCGSEEQKVIAITSNKEGTKLAVATHKALFFITINDVDNDVDNVRHEALSQDVLQILNDNEYSIKKLSLNNQGTVLCVVTQPVLENTDHYDEVYSTAKVYLCAITEKDLSVAEITKELQGNHDLEKYEWSVNRTCLSDVSHLHWNHDDSLLVLQCSYCYQNIYQGRLGSSHYAGDQYAFVCPTTGNGWSESEIRVYSKPIVSSNDGQAIITDNSGWFTHTQCLRWYDEHMVQALRYFDIQKSDEKFSAEQKSTGIALLYKILQHRNAVVQLDKEESAIYNDDMPDSIKKLLSKIRIVLPYKKITSQYVALQRWIHIQGLRCKQFLYNYRKPLLVGVGALLLAVMYANYYVFINENVLLLAHPNRFKMMGVIDAHVLSTGTQILK